MEKGRDERLCWAWRWEVLAKGKEPLWVPQSLGPRVGGGLGRGDSGGRTLGGLATKGRGDSTYLGGLLPNCWTVMENTVRASVRIVF